MKAEMWTHFGMQLIWTIPWLLACLATFICALVLRSRYPRAATLAAIGIAIHFLSVILGCLFSAYAITHPIPFRAMSFLIVQMLSLMGVAGFVLMFIAVFVGRAKSPAPPAPPPIPPHA